MNDLAQITSATNPRYLAYLRAGGTEGESFSYMQFIAAMKRAFPGTQPVPGMGDNHGVIVDHEAFTAFIEATVATGRVYQANGGWEVEA
ncbi:hypothetical protein GCM10011348_46070 [Marinobacterium nitratireducens]|uniref:Uncharacterized protein n=1 Tax=Marinobacterium nitratireducens TaxID=518897 RepID=A0A917ZPU6_9GAMM|nr:hypothetical protein [Marinobacterium nitratireducens]GGO89103.1 hypothetical protein GCM10011348_46070 [Marinobacterium nitratireducens]